MEPAPLADYAALRRLRNAIATRPAPISPYVEGSGTPDVSGVKVAVNRFEKLMIDVFPVFPVTLRILPTLAVVVDGIAQVFDCSVVLTAQFTGEMISCTDDKPFPKFVWMREAVVLATLAVPGRLAVTVMS